MAMVEITLEIPLEVMEALERIAKQDHCGPVDVAERLLIGVLVMGGHVEPEPETLAEAAERARHQLRNVPTGFRIAMECFKKSNQQSEEST